MGYRELLQALEDEVGCQVRELREKAIEESRHIRAATERDIVSKRSDTLDAEGHRPKRAKSWHPETVRRILHRLYK